MAVTVLDLFSGIGGMSLAIAASLPKSRTVAFCDNNPFATSVLKDRMRKNQLHHAPVHPDVRNLHGSALPRIDLITAGFPCQDLSSTGRRKGLTGSRSGLVNEVVRLLKETKASFVFLENVPNILLDKGYPALLGKLRALDFECAWGLYRVDDIPGGKHMRKRWFLLGKKINAPPLKIRHESKALLRHLTQKTKLTEERHFMRAKIQSFLLGNTVVPEQARRAFVDLALRLQDKGGGTSKGTFSDLDVRKQTVMRGSRFFQYPTAKVPLVKQKPFKIIPPAPRRHAQNQLPVLRQSYTASLMPTPRTGPQTTLATPTLTTRSKQDTANFLMNSTLFRNSLKKRRHPSKRMVSHEYLSAAMGYPKNWISSALSPHCAKNKRA